MDWVFQMIGREFGFQISKVKYFQCNLKKKSADLWWRTTGDIYLWKKILTTKNCFEKLIKLFNETFPTRNTKKIIN